MKITRYTVLCTCNIILGTRKAVEEFEESEASNEEEVINKENKRKRTSTMKNKDKVKKLKASDKLA